MYPNGCQPPPLPSLTPTRGLHDSPVGGSDAPPEHAAPPRQNRRTRRLERAERSCEITSRLSWLRAPKRKIESPVFGDPNQVAASRRASRTTGPRGPSGFGCDSSSIAERIASRLEPNGRATRGPPPASKAKESSGRALERMALSSTPVGPAPPWARRAARACAFRY